MLRDAQHLASIEVPFTRGDVQGALSHYRRFIELWSDADPENRPLVGRARTRVAEQAGRA